MRVLQAKTKRPLDLLAIGAGGHIAAASSEFGVRGDVEVWESTKSDRVYTHTGASGEVNSLAFSPDGKCLFMGNVNAATILDLASHNPLPTPHVAFGFPEFSFSVDGSRLLMAESANNQSLVKCFTVEGEWAFRELWVINPTQRVLFGHPALSKDGKWAAVSVHDWSRDRVRNHVNIYDPKTGKILVGIAFDPTGANPILQLCFSADGTKLLIRAAGRTVKIFDVATGQAAGELLHPGRPYVTGMAVHPNGTIACSRNNGTVCLWNLETHELVRTLDWKLGKLVS
ncbi:MAG: WD40 repeat domain-containing protein, partial [Gemmataceae bacterium]